MAKLESRLAAFFDWDEQTNAKAIGEDPDLSEKEKVLEMFRTLPDPLLDLAEIAALLGIPSSATLKTSLDELVTEGQLESDTKTQRALDPAGTVLYRLGGVTHKRLKIPALESVDSNGTRHFQFTIEGRMIRSFASIERLDAWSGEGNQRAEIEKHIERIAEGLRVGTSIPNSIILVLLESKLAEANTDELGDNGVSDSPESFARIIEDGSLDMMTISEEDFDDSAPQVKLVMLDFPFRRASFDSEKCALIVDGQQRTAALSMVELDRRPELPVRVNMSIADGDGARLIFTTANSTEKIKTEFKNALQAVNESEYGFLKGDALTATACRQLAVLMTDSPFHGVTRHPGYPTTPASVIPYLTLFKTVREFEKLNTDWDSPSDLAAIVSRSFNLVKATWPSDWGQRPSSQYRLMHGASILALANLMAERLKAFKPDAIKIIPDGGWTRLEELVTKLPIRTAFSVPSGASGTPAANQFFNQQVKERQNTAIDIAKLTRALSDVKVEMILVKEIEDKATGSV